MKDFFYPIFGAIAIVLVQSQITLAQTIDDVKNIAEKVTVKIIGREDPGSGVIIGRNGNIYYVLTARHVLDSTGANEEAYIDTYDGREHQIDLSKARKSPNNIDLLLIPFESEQDYHIATISSFNYRLYSNDDYENNLFFDASSKPYVFVSGWPLTETAKRVFSPGILSDNSGSAISSKPDINSNTFGGYELAYTNLTHLGMAGAPILDTKGRLIGIHGRADGRVIGQEDEIIQDYLEEVGTPVAIKVGLSLGIPIQTFLSWASNYKDYSSLNVEDSAPPAMSQAIVNDWQPPITIKDLNNPYHWLQKANQLWRIGRIAEARGAFDNAIALKEDLYLAWFAKGFAEIFDEQYQRALKSCSKAIELQINPSLNKYASYRCKALALKALQRFEEALDSLNDAIAINPNNPDDWMTQGELKYALGQNRGALESFNKAIELRKKQNLPDSALLYNNRGFIQLELKQYELALENVETAIRIDSKYPPAWSNKGLILETMERNEDALDAYNQATKLATKDYAILTNRAFVLYKLDRYEEAKQSLERALKINPDFQPAINSLEQIYLIVGQ